jgi:hypothetical protein
VTVDERKSEDERNEEEREESRASTSMGLMNETNRGIKPAIGAVLSREL